MKASEADRGALTAEGCWLLIGNSRWHWAAPSPQAGGALNVWHTTPPAVEASGLEPLIPAALRPGDAGPSASGDGASPLLADGVLAGWAAVGPLPQGVALPPQARLQLEEVPLLAAPPWLGIDRALAGWWAWRLTAGPVLVADAGTVLSLTRVDQEGRFCGGRLLAGASLQLRAMASGTAQLPRVDGRAGQEDDAMPGPWPRDTEAAMRSGVLRGLAAAVASAASEARLEEPACRLMLTGGDGALLASLLDPDLRAELQPHLCLEALAALKPWNPQPSPRSARI